MYYNAEQLQLLRQDYSQMFGEIILKLQSRKAIYEMLATSAQAGKIMVCGGAMLLGGASIALAGHMVTTATGLNPLSVTPISGFSMLGLTGAIISEGLIVSKTKQKMDSFTQNVNERLNEQIDSCNILINFFRRYQTYSMMDDTNFEQLIFQFAQFYKSCIDEKKFVGIKIIDELIGANEKYSKINESDELVETVKQKQKNISLLKLLAKERQSLSDGFEKFYYDSVNFYNSNFARGSYQ